MKFINKQILIRMLTNESAAVSVMFATVFPSLILFYSLAFDGANLNNQRARLMDGINQGVLAVALTDNRQKTEADRQNNKTALSAYTRYYLPGVTVPESELNIEVALNTNTKGRVVSVDYSAAALAQVKTMLGSVNDSGLGTAVDIAADSGAGVVRRTLSQVHTPTDFLFVVDFSGSMNSQVSGDKITRIALVKKIFAEFIDLALVENDIAGNTIGMVPYSVGTPERLDIDNILGGKETGCSFVGKLKDSYNIDFNYWYNKNVRPGSNWSSSDSNVSNDLAAGYYHNVVRAGYTADYFLSDLHYNNIVKENISPKTWSEMVSRGWCQTNQTHGKAVGRYEKSCEVGGKKSIFALNNDAGILYNNEFTENYQKAGALMTSAYGHSSIININTLDVDATLADGYLFSDTAITTYITLFSTSSYYRPFSEMCANAGATDSAEKFKSVTKPKYYSIPLTRDIATLKQVQSMVVGGNTDSANGLLRAVPVIAKGQNAKKVIILLTDGEDTGSASSGPKALTNLLVRDKKLCSVIKEGLLKYPEGTPTTSVDIYYFSVVDDDERIKFWGDNCVGTKNSIVAKNYKELMESMTAIATKGQVKFINKNEETD